MSIKSVLVHLDPRTNVTGVLDVALELARQHRAHVVGLWPIAEAGSERSPLEQTFRERAKRLQLSHEWSRVAGNEAATLVLESRCHDLLVIGQADPREGRFWPQAQHLLESALLKSGHPLIAVPRSGAFPSVGERILVAWDGAREAARAVEDAMPILERAEQVTLVTVDLRSGEALSADHLVVLLERHGVQISVQGARSHGAAIGEVLLGRARELSCDLLVMGGYGHSPLREHLFGGPTYFVLRHMNVPVPALTLIPSGAESPSRPSPSRHRDHSARSDREARRVGHPGRPCGPPSLLRTVRARLSAYGSTIGQ